ncbi:MAG: ABC transporter substrate-binding protein [Myxococcales bacterium]|nr:ABC transporter substrate-binding protein [Myxococcales bacterium]
MTATHLPRLGAGAPLRFACHAPLSGPMALFGDIPRAARARFAEVNASGGVHGHPIELVIGDDRYEPERTPAVVEELLGLDDLLGFALCVGTPPHLTVVDRLAALSVPDLAVVTGAASLADPERPAMFIANPPYAANARVLGGAVAGGRGGVITYDTDFGRDWARGFAEGRGGPTSVRFLRPGEVDDAAIGASIDAMAAAGVDAILLAVQPDHEVAAIRRGHAIGLRPRWLVAFVDTVIAQLGALAEGVIGSHWLHMAEASSHPAIVDHRRLLAERAPDVSVSGSSLGGHALADLIVELLRRAGPSPTRERLSAAYATLDGGWASPLMRVAPRKHPTRPVIFDDVELLEVVDGAWTPLEGRARG